MRGKKIIRGFFCAFLCMMTLLCGLWPAVGKNYVYAVAAEEEAPDPAQLYAASAVLMDADTGRVLYGKNEDTPLAMASTTKIMTCILVLEMGDPDEEIAVSAYAASMPKVKLYVKKGERYRVGDLLYSLMLESHNDSAVVLAEYIGKQFLGGELAKKDTAEYSVEESKQAVAVFADLMNRKAADIGCEDTNFITPNGLDAGTAVEAQTGPASEGTADAGKVRDHHTTATELARIMSYCIKFSPERDVFLEITRTPAYSFYANGRNFSCNNHNAFLNMMEGALSGKTGFTNKAGYCYVGALERDGRTFVVALLACGWPNHKSYKWSDTGKLMEYGTRNFFVQSLKAEDESGVLAQIKPIQVIKGCTGQLGAQAWANTAINETGRGLTEMLLGEDEKVEMGLQQLKVLEAPVEKGTVVGYVTYSVQGVIYRVEDIVVTENVDEITFKWCLEEVFVRFLL